MSKRWVPSDITKWFITGKVTESAQFFIQIYDFLQYNIKKHNKCNSFVDFSPDSYLLIFYLLHPYIRDMFGSSNHNLPSVISVKRVLVIPINVVIVCKWFTHTCKRLDEICDTLQLLCKWPYLSDAIRALIRISWQIYFKLPRYLHHVLLSLWTKIISIFFQKSSITNVWFVSWMTRLYGLKCILNTDNEKNISTTSNPGHCKETHCPAHILCCLKYLLTLITGRCLKFQIHFNLVVTSDDRSDICYIHAVPYDHPSLFIDWSIYAHSSWGLILTMN